MNSNNDVVIVGAGFTGLTAGVELSRAGKKVIIIENDSVPGGLAGTFQFDNGAVVEKFYHHWFNNDKYVPELVAELGLEDQIELHPSRTGMYYSGKLWKLSTPMDLLKFSPLSFINRVRLGLLVFLVRRVKDWKTIEHLSIREWLMPLCGESVYKIVWEPLVESKFSVFSEDVNAVWMWKKLVLRGSTRDKKGGEQLAYFKGGFGRLAQAMADEIINNGGEIRYNTNVTGAVVEGKKVTALNTTSGEIQGKAFLCTPSFPIIANIFAESAEKEWLDSMSRVNYLGNMCLVLQLKKSLSDTYWLNVNDPGFPFVGVIEHTNFDLPENYKGNHIVYLSRYLAKQDPVWQYSDEKYLSFALEHLKRMFPEFDESWIVEYYVWRADYAQPITERNYSKYVPSSETPYENLTISTMAQIYPEDRGTNYAIRDGRHIAKEILQKLNN